jgi:diguanylate cyclase (GGDEF)-like protein
MTTQVGRVIWVVISANMTHYENRQCLGLSFNDITSRKLAEESEKQERIFAEALSASVSTLNSTLKFEEVLDRLLSNLEKVIPNNHANIMLVDENNDARIVRARGYDAELLQKLLEQINLHVDETPTLLRMSVTGEPLVIADTMTDPIWVKRVSSAWIRSYLGAPIHVKGKVVGYINLDSDQANVFNRIHTERLRLFADQAAIAIENARLFEQTEQMATIDYLTGLYNRRYFFELSETEFKRYKRYKKPFSLILLDLDHFKDINDRHGHAAGDLVLQNLAKVFRDSLRSMDIPGRIGGEEFVILLPETNHGQAVLVADRLRKDIEEAKHILEGSEVFITASMGVVSASDEYPSLQAMILAADGLMYRAKEEGRNRIVSAG